MKTLLRITGTNKFSCKHYPNIIAFVSQFNQIVHKRTGDEQGRTPYEIDSAIKQLVSEAVSSNEVEDIFASVGVDKPDIALFVKIRI